MVNFVLPIRATQLLFAIIAIAISGYIVGQVNALNDVQSRFSYNVFTSLWTILVLAYLIGIQFIGKDSAIAHPIISVAIDALTWVFWLAAFAAAAATIGHADGSHNSIIGALVAFGVLEWLLFSVTLALAVLGVFRQRSGSSKAGANGV